MNLYDTAEHTCRKCGTYFNYNPFPDRIFQCPGCKRQYEVSKEKLIIRGDLFMDDKPFPNGYDFSNTKRKTITIPIPHASPGQTALTIIIVGVTIIVTIGLLVGGKGNAETVSYDTVAADKIIVKDTLPKRLYPKPSMQVHEPTLPSNVSTTTSPSETISKDVPSYSFNGMVAVPWTYYKIIEGKFIPVPFTDPQFDEIVNHWSQFKREIEQMTINLADDEATLTIFTPSSDNYILQKRTNNIYSLEGDGIGIVLEIKDRKNCTIYFCRENTSVAVSNIPIYNYP